MGKGKPWSREDVIVAYALYCVIPFSKVNNSNQLIKDVAARLGRSPMSLKMKICNLAALDPDFLMSGRTGLWNGVTRLDRTVFEEFSNDWPGLSALAERLAGLPLFNANEPVYNGPGRQKRKTYAEIAEKQVRKFFRSSVLAAYEGRCCLSGIALPSLLNASHIKPFAVCTQSEKAFPANGILFNTFYDCAFDKGLMTILPDLSVKISRAALDDPGARKWLLRVDGVKIKRPRRFAPNRDLLSYHNKNIFLG